MPLELVTGPPGSGKTTRLLAEVRAAAQRGERVWWIGLPAQRSHVLRALTKEGPLLGAEFLTPQQLAYRLLADARRLRPLLTGTGRLATVGEALAADRDDPPSPGEARLFARAIAEAKRHGLPAGKIPGDDPETARLRRVHHLYETLKGDAWDYDDFRVEAGDWLDGLPAAAVATPSLLPDRLVVDGFRELGPLDLRLFEAMASHRPVTVAVAVPPPGRVPDVQLSARDDVEVRAYRFPNPVAEARWVLRDVKAALAGGAQPLDLALIVPPGRARAIATLADEYGVPLMDETPRGLTDRPEGRRLLDLLEMSDQPTASRLLGIPELRALGVAALEAGVGGRDAVARLAEARGEGDLWRSWLARLEPTDDVLAWGAALVDAALDAAFGAGPDPAPGEVRSEIQRFREQALQRLAEARRVADGPRIREWWAALLQETTVFERPAAGVALLHAVQASGRRFRRAWIVGATEGAHLAREREDYFVPEEARSSWEATFQRPLLPRRFLARQGAEIAELRARGDVTVVTAPEGDQAGPTLADPRLVGDEPAQPPELPAGSVLDLGGGRPYDPPDGPVDLGPPDVQRLARFAECGFRHWAETRLREDDEAPWWAELRRTLRSRGAWDQADLRRLGQDTPQVQAWLDLHAEELSTFTFGVELADPDGGPRAFLDAARRQDGVATLVRFVAPGAARGAADVERILDARSTEYWAAAHLLERHGRAVRSVRFRVWPILAPPLDFPERGPVATSWGRFRRVRREVDAALPAWRAGAVRASPGYVCRDCAVFDLCREGRR